MLGLTFHPQYADASNGFFYVNYTRQSDDATFVARYLARSKSQCRGCKLGLDLIDGSPTLHQPQRGQLRFGPDGYLYIGLGDGGSSNDPERRAQNLNTLLGKMLSINVDNGSPYAMPSGNPYQNDGDPNTLGEIWAYGLRNPWRFSFDRVTGDLFIADVGQGNWEEIDFQGAGTGGGANYGWRIMEGAHCTGLESPSACSNPALFCRSSNIHTRWVARSQAATATGGNAIPALAGYFLYGDYCSGRIWGATQSGSGAWTTNQLLVTGFNISTFGENDAGEIYVAAYNTGSIYRIVSPS